MRMRTPLSGLSPPYLSARGNRALSHPFSSSFRTSQQSADDEKWFIPESEAALAKTLRRYLPYLELLSQAPTANARPRIEHATRPAKVMLQPTYPLWPAPGLSLPARMSVHKIQSEQSWFPVSQLSSS